MTPAAVRRVVESPIIAGVRILAVDDAVLATIAFATEWRAFVFGARLVAFALTACGIVEKQQPIGGSRML